MIMDELIEKAIQGEKDGYDGVIFACFLDPGVLETREEVLILGPTSRDALVSSL